MAVAVPIGVRCFGHALVRRVEVQVGVRPERAALRELALLLRRVRVARRGCHGGARVSGLMRRVERVWRGCGEGAGRQRGSCWKCGKEESAGGMLLVFYYSNIYKYKISIFL